MCKYKPILRDYKNFFEKVLKNVSDPNKTHKQNIQKAIDVSAKIFADATEHPEQYKQIFYEDTVGTKEQAIYSSIALKAIIDELNGKIIHYFIKDNSLVDFLKTTKVKDTSIVREYIKEKSEELQEDIKYYSIAVHSENESHLFTYLITEDKVISVVFFDGNALHFALGADTSDAPVCNWSINMLYYLKAFPEKILNGVPQDMVKNDKRKFDNKMCHSIDIADEIVEKTEVVNGRIVTPHFRSGFFRHYTDDRYVNMKGKVQFIAATMVKGKAKTVVA